MASVDTGGGDGKKGKPKRMNLRVDFTPMVDMNMLLLTFFMFCTTLSKPQVMNLVMPTNDDVAEDQKDKVPESKTITMLLGKNHKVYYYQGKPKYEDYQSLKEASFDPNDEDKSMRKVLLTHNREAAEKMRTLRLEKANNKISEEVFLKSAGEVKSDKNSTIVVIKPTEDCKYVDLVDALDEMAVCSIGKYAIVPFDEASDGFLMKNLESKGKYAAENLDTAPQK